jgi:hypothetical protein
MRMKCKFKMGIISVDSEESRGVKDGIIFVEGTPLLGGV